MIQDILKEVIHENIGHLKPSNKGWFTRNCMMCHHRGESPDFRGRFGIIFSPDGTIATKCFNCGFKSKFVPGELFSRDFTLFLQEIGVSQKQIQELGYAAFRNLSYENKKQIQISESIVSKWKNKKSLPEDARPISDWLELGCNDPHLLRCAEYMVNKRNIDSLHDFYWTPQKDRMLNKRVLIPYIYNKEVVGYTGRFVGTPPSKSMPKYLNQGPEDYIYNIDVVFEQDRKYIFLCEGVIDAYVLKGVSPAGNELSDLQIDYLNKFKDKIIVIPDFDQPGKALLDVASDNKWAVSIPSWAKKYKDASSASYEIGRIGCASSVIDGIITEPLEYKVKWSFLVDERN